MFDFRRHLGACLVLLLLTVPAWAAPFAYIANQFSHDVSVIDTSTHTVIDTVAVGSSPYGVAVNPAGTRVYVTNLNSPSVSVIDTATHTVMATVAVGAAPMGVVINPAGTRAYVTNMASNNVLVIDTTTHTVTATVAVGAGPAAFGLFIGPAAAPAAATPVPPVPNGA